jgi:hypothetical protein
MRPFASAPASFVAIPLTIDAIRRLWTDDDLRQSLAERGRIQVSRFTWAEPRVSSGRHYRSLGKRSVSERGG